MTNGFNGEQIIEWLLSWFKWLAGSIFDSATGSSGSSIINIISHSWKGILSVLLIAGCALNLIIFIIRWRPHWWWFAKKRMLVDDSIFEPRKRRTSEPEAKRPSTIVPRREKPAGTKPRHRNMFEADEDRPASKTKRSR